jgi:membrane protein CcdC involved in cytochrome C biogenesis
MDFVVLVLPWVALVVGPVIVGAVVVVILLTARARPSAARSGHRPWLLLGTVLVMLLIVAWLLVVWPVAHALIFTPGEFLP